MTETITSTKDYLEKIRQSKIINLPSGAIFKIKKASVRDFIFKGNLPISSTKDVVASKDKLVEQWQAMSDENKRKSTESMDYMIVKAVDEPKLCIEPEEGKLPVSDIVDEDYYFLLKEVTEFSYGRGKDTAPFRTEKEPDNAGQNSAEVQGSTDRIAESGN